MGNHQKGEAEQNDLIKQGDKIIGTVKEITPYQLWIEFDGSITGSCSIEEIRWKDETEDLFPMPEIGESYVFLVMRTGKHPNVSYCRCRRDPWDDVKTNFPEGKIVSFEVERVAKYAYGEITEGIEAKVDVPEIKEYFKQFTDMELKFSLDIYVGDRVEAIITGYDEVNRYVTVSLKKRLEEFQTNKISNDLSELIKAYSIPEHRYRPQTPEEATQPSNHVSNPTIKTIAIFDMDTEFRTLLSEYLIGSDYKVIIDGTIEMLLEGSQELFDADLFFLEFSMIQKQASIDLKAFISKLNELGYDQPIVLVLSSYESPPDNEFPILWKPIGTLQEINDVIDDVISRATTETQPVPEPNETVIENSAYEKLEQLLHRACEQFRAKWGVVFSLHPVSNECDMLASYECAGQSGLLEKFNRFRSYLARSPVRDCAIRREEIFDSEAPARPGKHRHLLFLCNYIACIGLPLDSPGEKRYCMFLLFDRGLPRDLLFHDGHIFTFFDRSTKQDKKMGTSTLLRLRSQLWATKMSAVLTEINVLNSITKAHEFSNRGLVFESIGHEVNEDISSITAKLDKVEAFLINNQQGNALRELREAKSKNEDLAGKIKRLSGITSASGYNTRIIQEEIKKSEEYLKKYARLKWVDLDLQTTGETELIAYPSGIDQIITNLILNAIDQISNFIRKKGKVILRISQLDTPERPIRILVIDNGPGIHYRDWESIFEPGYTTKPGGSGLGLAITRRLIESMDGKVRVNRSIIFVGTIFEVELYHTYHYRNI